MNQLSIACPCGRQLTVCQGLSGQRAKCPKCNAVLAVETDSPTPQPLAATTPTTMAIRMCGQPLSVPEKLHGRQVKCLNCSQLISMPAMSPSSVSEDPLGTVDATRTTSSADLSRYTSPGSTTQLAKPSVTRKSSGYRNYMGVPWYRKSGTNTGFILGHLLTCGVVPLLILTCIVLVTGNVYYHQADKTGSLKK